ncbi:RagB/SusD family nutrient uptake outer membrane protein [Rhizosphaericola mali]|uniref:RagB/SusD family nutrient uptake outer membrane protein n=1 Tax=Rhizosphaericola mali TaxID=2545455 RepID=A0A5P2FYA6_9BACT|nr:RagB/SusD family nutrient uptake outer membrane protein [Rhizosphaericola mali]QES87368.1 RagB/SusD family nutrient uptake outer membrane protein [Rhizosphaericola mali]
MKLISNIYLCTILFVMTLASFACNKTEFLDTKPSSDISTPSNLSDLRAILDNITLSYHMNYSPMIAETSADDYFLDYSSYQALVRPYYRNAYSWQTDIWEGATNASDWEYPYQEIFYCNVVLNALNKMELTAQNQSEFNSIKGDALLIRAFNFFNLLQIFAPAFDSSTAASDLGIPLKLNADINEKMNRSNVLVSYQQVINDLQEALTLLPEQPSSTLKNRGSKAATYAMLARVYLSMRDYSAALKNANSSYVLYNTLLDYNNLNKTANSAFPTLNPEVSWVGISISNYPVSSSSLSSATGYSIDTTLYKMYDNNDLRKTFFFKVNTNGKTINVKGNYLGASYSSIYKFTGLATDEILIIKAECEIRNNQRNDALNDLNELLKFRYANYIFPKYDTLNNTELLNRILQERRKELVLRNIRWSDLRRLNKEGANIILSRNLNGNILILEPNSSKYIFPIPDYVIQLSGMEQNKRE